MDIKSALEYFHRLNETLHAYNHATSLIYYDSVTVAPKDSAAGRGKTMGILAGLQYDLTAAPETVETVAYLVEHKDELDPIDRRAVEEYDRGSEYVRSIPKQEYEEYTVLVNDAESVWHKAKEENDFAAFAPYLEKIFDTNRRFAGYYRPEMPAYDVMLDQYERGLTTQKADEFFTALRARIVPLIKRIGESQQVDDSFLYKFYPVEKQRELSDYLMQVMCIDRSHCAIGETEHPFTMELNKNDVRITTHYYENSLASSMYSVVHEGGHALYELGGGAEYEGTPLSGGVSMGIHESQSRLYENIIGRSEPFINVIFPKLKELFPQQLEGVDAHQFWLAVNKSEPSLIRTEADELTYSLHVMIRYELEKSIIAGELNVADLPAAWNAKYREYLGVDVPDDTHGVLQDSHWSGGSVGYFPSYALGSAYGAQMIARMAEDIDIDAAIETGSLAKINAWLEEHIFRHSSRYDPGVLFEMCCGKPFDPQYYIDYLEEKYSRIYGLK